MSSTCQPSNVNRLCWIIVYLKITLYACFRWLCMLRQDVLFRASCILSNRSWQVISDLRCAPLSYVTVFAEVDVLAHVCDYVSTCCVCVAVPPVWPPVCAGVRRLCRGLRHLHARHHILEVSMWSYRHVLTRTFHSQLTSQSHSYGAESLRFTLMLNVVKRNGVTLLSVSQAWVISLW